jgi:hypothetical protein
VFGLDVVWNVSGVPNGKHSNGRLIVNESMLKEKRIMIVFYKYESAFFSLL